MTEETVAKAQKLASDIRWLRNEIRLSKDIIALPANTSFQGSELRVSTNHGQFWFQAIPTNLLIKFVSDIRPHLEAELKQKETELKNL